MIRGRVSRIRRIRSKGSPGSWIGERTDGQTGDSDADKYFGQRMMIKFADLVLLMVMTVGECRKLLQAT